MNNTYVKTDSDGSINPDKRRSTQKIEGAITFNYGFE